MVSIHDDVLTEPHGSGLVADGGVAVASAPALPPLTISALMVTKADVIAALRVYLPHLSDIEVISGDRFLLTVGDAHPEPAVPGAQTSGGMR